MHELVFHTLNPIYNSSSKILILGTMPSPKSREVGFYYSHPQNRFWKVLSDLFFDDLPTDINSKNNFLYKHNIALWDVLKSCDIDKASDSSIKNPVVNNFEYILENSNIKQIFTTGKIATNLYNKYCYEKTNIETTYLPSTSPANCGTKYEDLVKSYSIILKYL